MAEKTKIAWADATANFWIGCATVSPACENCYAIPIAAAMGVAWGDDGPRHRTGEDNWRKGPRWNAMHDRGQTLMMVEGKPERVPKWVFPNSLSDFFDNHPDMPAWRAEAWQVIRRCALLNWIILTKRIPNVLKMLPADWNGGRDYRHVGIVASVGDQMELDRDLPRLVALKTHGVHWVGLSIEPQLEPISLPNTAEARNLDWIVSGGESQQGKEPARRYDMEWASQLIVQCHVLGIRYFHKQVGSNAFHDGKRFRTKDRAGADDSEWPEHLRVQQLPTIYGDDERLVSQPTLF
jgi:protein gp37